MGLITTIMRNEDVSRQEAIEILREEFEECNKDLEVALYNLGFELDYAYEALKYVKI